jgi:hypothetical protein
MIVVLALYMQHLQKTHLAAMVSHQQQRGSYV